MGAGEADGALQAGRREIVFALANHHDNFDAYDSKHHAWNSVNVGPKKDIVGAWAKVARANGLRFGVSNHSAHACEQGLSVKLPERLPSSEAVGLRISGVL